MEHFNKVRSLFGTAGIPVFSARNLYGEGTGTVGAYLTHGEARLLKRKMALHVETYAGTPLDDTLGAAGSLFGAKRTPYMVQVLKKSTYSQRVAPLVRGLAHYQKVLGLTRLAGAAAVPLVGVAAGAAAADAAGFYFRACVKTLDYATDAARAMHALELGGMGLGFYTPGAATERQHLSYELKNSSYGNRRFLGQEASFMAGM